MIRNILFASTNLGKIKEINDVVKNYPNIQLLSLSDISAKFGPPPEVVEDGETYQENAALKARAYFDWCGYPSLADDAGLEVDALNGAPGVISARYAGEPVNSQKNLEKLLRELSTVGDRRARFVSCLHFKIEKNLEIVSYGYVEGKIAEVATGNGGFGYDPIFIPSGYKESLSALKEKGIIVPTHRIISTQNIFKDLNSRGLI